MKKADGSSYPLPIHSSLTALRVQCIAIYRKNVFLADTKGPHTQETFYYIDSLVSTSHLIKVWWQKWQFSTRFYLLLQTIFMVQIGPKRQIFPIDKTKWNFFQHITPKKWKCLFCLKLQFFL